MSYRDHEPYHERRLEQQTLDALLRIEEILARAFPAEEDAGLIEGDVIPAGSVKPDFDTPFFKAVAKKGKRK
jgi:hypothetical protein